MSTRRSFLRFLGLGAATVALPNCVPNKTLEAAETLPPELARLGMEDDLKARYPAFSFTQDLDTGVYQDGPALRITIRGKSFRG